MSTRLRNRRPRRTATQTGCEAALRALYWIGCLAGGVSLVGFSLALGLAMQGDAALANGVIRGIASLF